MNKGANTTQEDPNIIKWALKFATSAGIAGILCCVAPAVLFMFGLMGGIYAISFADFFYAEDGSIGLGSWILRGLAVIIGLFGVYVFRKKQNQCSINPKRKKKNLILMTIITIVLGVGIFLSLEKLSSWYFNKHIVPAQQEEFRKMDQNKK
jgi:H+/Cl- antiporter ClcA